MSSLDKVLVIDLDKSSQNQKLLDGEPATRGMRSGRVYLAPGQACGEHSTKDREELLVFLSGRGELHVSRASRPRSEGGPPSALRGQDGRDTYRFQVGQGKVCYIPPQTAHDVKNTGVEPLVYVYCVTPVPNRLD